MIRISNNFEFKELYENKFALSINLFVLITINVLLLNHPLTRVLGYEFSAVNSLFLVLLSGIFTLRWIRKANTLSGTYFTFLAILLAIPLLINIINSLFTEFCSFSDGILFYSAITFPSVFIGASLASFINYLFSKFRYVLFFALILTIAVIPILEIYFYPQLYFYNMLIAYFPGTIYDEGLAVDLKLVFYRLCNLLFIGIIVYLIFKDQNRNHRTRNLVIVLTVSIIFFFVSPYIGFSTTKTIVNNLLSKKIETVDFKIHLDETISENESRLISLFSEYYFQSLKSSIQVTPARQIDIFLFRDAAQKKKYFGSANADVAKPWLYQIYISQESWRGTLKHELAHIFSAEFGSTIFKVAGNFNPFLIEGFATSQDPFKDNLHIDYLASLYYHFNEGIDLSKITGHTNFFETQSFASYTISGSISNYLISNYGINKFKQYYQSNDFTKSYNILLDTVISEFNNYLLNIKTDFNINSYNYYFGRQSITQKVCPRFVGKMIQKGWEQIKYNQIEEAKYTFNNVLQKVPEYSALVGLGECLIKQDSLEGAILLYESFYPKFDSTPYHYLLKLRLADSYVQLNRSNQAALLYQELFTEKPTINLELLSATRLRLLADERLFEYLTSDDISKLQILLDINRSEYFYPSFPAMINLALSTGEEYSNFIKKFDKTFFITDLHSAYAVFRISEFMIENFDFRNARKMAALARRYRELEHLNQLWNKNFEMAEWFYYNADEFLNQFIQDEAN